MSLESRWKRLLITPATRREFGLLAGASGLGFVGGVNFLRTTERVPLLKEEDKTIFPGWIEANTSQKFIQQDKGHFYFLREAILNNPLLMELTQDYFQYFNSNLSQGKRLDLGEALSQAIESSHKKLTVMEKQKISSKSDLVLESVHAGLFVFAVGFVGQWWEASDLNKFGVSLEGYKNAADYLNGTNGLLTNVYPNLFVKEGFKRENDGPDRAVHFAQHLLITFEYLYSKGFKLGLDESLPNLLKFLVFASSDKSLDDQARSFSKWVGIAWEYSTLSDLNNWPVISKKNDITEGPFDPMVEADYKANQLGAEAAVMLFNILKKEASIEQIISVVKGLNDKRFYGFETEPAINF